MDKIINYIEERKKDLDVWSNGLDDGVYSSALITYETVIKMLKELENK